MSQLDSWKNCYEKRLHDTAFMASALTTDMLGMAMGVMLLQLLDAVTSETHHFRGRPNRRYITEICCVMDTSQSRAQVSILLHSLIKRIS
jgi:hypothetical protein